MRTSKRICFLLRCLQWRKYWKSSWSINFWNTFTIATELLIVENPNWKCKSISITFSIIRNRTPFSRCREGGIFRNRIPTTIPLPNRHSLAFPQKKLKLRRNKNTRGLIYKTTTTESVSLVKKGPGRHQWSKQRDEINWP